MGKILKLLEYKKKIVEKLRDALPIDSIRKARDDPHSRRRPRPCGITIHTGIGCNLACSYCYIYDMGFTTKVSPYPLTSLELTYALSINPYVVPYKTFAAYGSVTEPFLLETREKALEYIATVFNWLSLPSQVSTKIAIDEELAKKLKKAEPNVSILVTLITINKASELEPLAPKPLERFNGILIASKHGLPVYLFVRPIIPSLTDKELNIIIKLGAECNARGVVLGSLRITKSIIQRLKNKGVNLDEILKRAPRIPKGREQIPIRINDIISNAEKIAQDYGLKVFRSACMANVDAHNDYCYMCNLGPCGNKENKSEIDHSDIIEYIEYIGLKAVAVEMRLKSIDIVVRGSFKRDKLEIAKTVLRYVSRKDIQLRSF